MRIMRCAILAAAAVVGGGLAACSGGNGKDAAPSGEPIIVTATDSTCEVGTTDVKAGTVVFKVTNKGSKVNEFYVYAAGDRVMGEVENIPPGLSRELRVELPAGTYETACKPGMTGKGIRGAFKVSGSAAALTDHAALAAAAEHLLDITGSGHPA